MSGTIYIGDNAIVNADSTDDGAGIGSGLWGGMSGTINIDGNADVTATSRSGAGVGSGDVYFASFSESTLWAAPPRATSSRWW